DVACGWGYYTFQLAIHNPSGIVVAVDLVPSAFTNMRRKQLDLGALGNFEPLMADATSLPLRDQSFDLAMSFLGLRDIHMTLGEDGVGRAAGELIRTARKTGRIAIAVTPPDLADSEELRVAIEVEGEVFGAKSMPSTFYTEPFQRKGVELVSSKSYGTGAKMTASQTMTELMDGIRIAREIYKRDVPEFDEVWSKYGPSIERHGYGMYSKITVFVGDRI
ncbi:MAG: class I SAM-dependent methyltransferase, partial [Candidatus Bathyarchaeia archaeon]